MPSSAQDFPRRVARRTTARRHGDLDVADRPDLPNLTRRCRTIPRHATRPACREPKPVRRNRSRERAARIARIRNRNRIQRPINEAHRRLQQARRREIDYRQTRNRMRKICSSSKADPAPAPTAPGSTTHSNPKSCHPIGNHPLNRHRSQTIRPSDDQHTTSTYTVFAVTDATEKRRRTDATRRARP